MFLVFQLDMRLSGPCPLSPKGGLGLGAGPSLRKNIEISFHRVLRLCLQLARCSVPSPQRGCVVLFFFFFFLYVSTLWFVV